MRQSPSTAAFCYTLNNDFVVALSAHCGGPVPTAENVRFEGAGPWGVRLSNARDALFRRVPLTNAENYVEVEYEKTQNFYSGRCSGKQVQILCGSATVMRDALSRVTNSDGKGMRPREWAVRGRAHASFWKDVFIF